MKLWSNAVADSNDENNFPHKLLLTNTQASRIRKFFANASSTNIKFSKIQLHPAAPATDTATHKKIFGSSMTTLIISNEEMNDIMKIVKSLE